MVVPIMIDKIKWGTYLFFAVVNATFIPIIYLFYPETKKRSLEEIDLIFAKGFLENISYVKASYDMPFLNEQQIKDLSHEYGFTDQDEEFRIGEKGIDAVAGSGDESDKGRASTNEGMLSSDSNIGTQDHAINPVNEKTE